MSFKGSSSDDDNGTGRCTRQREIFHGGLAAPIPLGAALQPMATDTRPAAPHRGKGIGSFLQPSQRQSFLNLPMK